jgi:S-DNA-T family DNA segregation ATPase FtsK/SpoIIIE
MPPAELMRVRNFFAGAKTHMREYIMILSKSRYISSLPRILYASGGINARAKFFAGAKTHMREYVMIFFENHDILILVDSKNFLMKMFLESGGEKVKTRKTQKKKYKVKEKQVSKYNHEIIGIIIFSMGVLIFLSFYLKNSIGPFGTFIKDFFLGAMGRPAYLIPPFVLVYGVFIMFKLDKKVFRYRALYSLLLLILLSAIIQTGYQTQKNYKNFTFARYIVEFYNDGKNLSGGGVLGGLVSTPLLLTFQTLGTIIILTTLCLIVIMLLTNLSIAGSIINLKTVSSNILGACKDWNDNRKAKGGEINILEPETGADVNAGVQIDKDQKVINFKNWNDPRELKDNTGNIDSSKDEENFDEFSSEHVNFVMNDIKKGIKKKREIEDKKTGEELEDVKPALNLQTGEYRFPPADLLEENSGNRKNIKTYKSIAIEGARKLEETLSSFGVAAKVINISRGPTVTRYELQPSIGVKVSKIVNLSDDISLNLASAGVRIEAPIPGKAAIGIEVANKEVSTVLLREVIESSEFGQHPSKLAFALGKDITGECIVADIAKMPHLLVAGATGSGKSVCINSLITSLIYKASPDEVKFLMVDPKVVELGVYNGIPHLLIPVVTDPKKAAGALNWAVQEMVNRYKLFADKAVRDIKGYNELMRSSGEGCVLPQIVVIIDELADLMMVAPNDVEDAICRLAQMARAAGMHLVIATQRPSVDVITGVIKANIPSRISFAVSSQVDSRTILDMSGAEKLLGKGDMLFYPVGRPKPIRVQGAFVSDKEVEKVVEFVKSQGSVEYDSNIIEEIDKDNSTVESGPEDDELLPRAIDLVVESGQASVSLIQRKLKVGYARAARIVDQMEERGIVGGYEGSKPRQILISKQQWMELKMSQDK